MPPDRSQLDINRQSGEPVFEMLCALKYDPSESNNLAQQPARKGKLAEMRSKCDEGHARVLDRRQQYAAHYKLEE